MAEITRRRTGEFLRELFNILIAEPDGVQASAALQALAGRVTLTPYEADSYDSGGRRFEKIVRFATVDCVKAGWLVKDKGIWSITEEGRKAYIELPDPEALTLPLFNVVHSHSVTRLVWPGPRASFLRTSSG
jgi:restriction system protein